VLCLLSFWFDLLHSVVLPEGWKLATSSDGGVYYYHSVTRASSWDPPPGSIVNHSASGGAGGASATDAGAVSSSPQARQWSPHQQSPRAAPSPLSARGRPAPAVSPRLPRQVPSPRGGGGGAAVAGSPPHSGPRSDPHSGPHSVSLLRHSHTGVPSSPLSNSGGLPPLNPRTLPATSAAGSPRGPVPPPLPVYTRPGGASSPRAHTPPPVSSLPPLLADTPTASGVPPAITRALPPPLSKAASVPGNMRARVRVRCGERGP
jgi:WW domain